METAYSPRGERLQSFGTVGFDQGQFNGPRGVAVARWRGEYSSSRLW